VLCYLDLETLKEGPGGEQSPTVVDFKVKNSPITRTRSPQTRGQPRIASIQVEVEIRPPARYDDLIPA
jgi:hypothetical protein